MLNTLGPTTRFVLSSRPLIPVSAGSVPFQERVKSAPFTTILVGLSAISTWQPLYSNRMFILTFGYQESTDSSVLPLEFLENGVDKHTGQIVATGDSAPRGLTDTSESSGLPKDCFELRQISGDEWDRFREFD
jgi:hypothetical protein